MAKKVRVQTVENMVRIAIICRHEECNVVPLGDATVPTDWLPAIEILLEMFGHLVKGRCLRGKQHEFEIFKEKAKKRTRTVSF